MVFENLQVKHNKFGIGVVVATQGKYLTVRFDTAEKNFVYPDAFEKFLTLVDGSVSDEILADLRESKNAKDVLLAKKQEELLHSMTHGIVIPGKETAVDTEEEERTFKNNSEQEEV
ncbi:MAG: hypothetical protein IJX38_01465 [Clostridia bacterium]|nr:hypothetical protein [Clostridia bacterium]